MYQVGELGVLAHNAYPTPAQLEVTASLKRLTDLRGGMIRMEAAYARAIERNLSATERMARDQIYKLAKQIDIEEAFFDFLLGGL